MRIIHTSDIHLDSRLSSRLTPDKAKIRRRELLLNLSRLFSEAKRLSAEAVIIAGDLFDSEKISERALDTALEQIKENPSVSVFYLPGNHEKNALLSCGREMPENLFFFTEEWSYFKAGEVVIAGRSKCSENMFESLDLKKGDKNIVVLHGELRDRCASPDIIGLRDAAERNIDYLALGHYHSYREYQINGGGVAVYSGTPEGRGFDESGECGFVLIDTEEGLCHSFIPFAKRRIHILEIDVTGLSGSGELQAACISALRTIPGEDIVRLLLKGERNIDLWIDTQMLAERLRGGYFCLDVKDCTRLSIKKEDYRYDKSLKGEFIRLVLSKEELDEDTRGRVIEMGLNALMGLEV